MPKATKIKRYSIIQLAAGFMALAKCNTFGLAQSESHPRHDGYCGLPAAVQAPDWPAASKVLRSVALETRDAMLCPPNRLTIKRGEVVFVVVNNTGMSRREFNGEADVTLKDQQIPDRHNANANLATKRLLVNLGCLPYTERFQNV